MSELVSILVPACNAERWIGAALESVLAQTWSHKEVIVVDDGSTDRTLEVAQGFAGRGVRVLAQANRGAAAARNTALGAAQGTYVQYLDADDLLHPDKLAAQLRGAEDGRRSRTLLTASWGRFFERPDHARFVPDSLWRDLSPVDWLVRKFTDNKFMFPAAWLVSRRLIDAAGPWNEALSHDDDGEYLCRLVAASHQVHFVVRAKAYYRIGNSASLSSQRSERTLRSGHASLRLCIGHLLALENSAATRSACVRLLQDNLRHVHPGAPDLASASCELARALGGELAWPHERAHFRLVARLLGWDAARQLRSTLNDKKLRVRRTLEGLAPGDAAAHAERP